MSIDSRQQADVRFFGAHDRAWVPAVHCLLFSEKDPNKTKVNASPSNTKNVSKSQKGIADAIKEKDDYIDNLKEKYGFKYAPFRTQLDANDLDNQIHKMLPGLKNAKNAEKELENSQKEKLTLKIIKGQSSKYQVEHKPGETTPVQKDKPKLYKVLSKNDDNNDIDAASGKLPSLIIKRKSNVDKDTIETFNKKPKKDNDNASETSESNASVQSTGSRRRAAGNASKHKKPTKTEKEASTEPEPKRGKHKEEPEPTIPDDEPSSKSKMLRRRTKSYLPDGSGPVVVSVVVPPGTDEIQQLREVSKSPLPTKQSKKRSLSYQRSRSVDKEIVKETQVPRRLSEAAEKPPQPVKRSKSVHEAQRRKSVQRKPPSPTKETFDPNLVIKAEPISDGEEEKTSVGEEVVQRKNLSVKDIDSLTQDKSGKRKVIVISTTENEPTSSTSNSNQGKAKKTFPNGPNQQQIEQLRNQQLLPANNKNWMVCIPQAALPSISPSASNRSSPSCESSTSAAAMKPISRPTSRRSSPNTFEPPQAVPRVQPQQNNLTPPITNNNHTSMQNGQHISALVSDANHNEIPPMLQAYPAYPPQIEAAAGFHRDLGPITRLFTDSAHRLTENFRNLIVETVTSLSTQDPRSENLILKAENERLVRDMATIKSDCQHRMQELRKEHQDEIETMRNTFGELTKKKQKLALLNE